MLYVYALTHAALDAGPSVEGIEEAIPFWLSSGGVAAVCTRLAGPAAFTSNNVLRHESVIESLMEDRTVLPCRFGSTFADESALRAVMRRNEPILLEALAHVRDQVELGLRVMWTQDGPRSTATPDCSCGRAYMLARLEQERQRERIAERAAGLAEAIERPLLECCTDHARGALAAGDALLKVAYLVPRGRTEEFRARVRESAAAHPDLRLLCTGPWPPYHFVPALSPAEVPRVPAS